MLVMFEATLSAKNQIVIPREVRGALRIKAGDKLLVIVRSDRVIILQKPNAYHAAIRGLSATPYPNSYLQEERKSWD
jgi:AbrB family looped-hinge helix DNA binding protein